MGSTGNQEPWVPFEPTKDCSQGFCSIYCPQWCYIIFPPPPPFFSDDDDQSSSGRMAFSPLVIAIIGVLASAFLLVSYYTIISKYCVSFSALRRRFHHHLHHVGPQGNTEEEVPGGASSRRYETWYNSPSNGLDEALINKISVCKYKSGDGLIDSTDCSVCLSEFREDESLRLLPKCNHAFHLHCIDTWLKSHSNCPLCRATIIAVNPMPPPLQLPAPPEPPPQPETSVELAVVAIEESNPIGEGQEEEEEEEENHEQNINDSTNKANIEQEEGIDHKVDVVKQNETVQVIRRSFSMDSSSSSSSSSMSSSHRGRVSIADVLRLSIDDDNESQVFEFARDQSKGSSSNRICRGLHCVMSPVPMKRSFSSGRFCFTSHAREKNSVLPL